MADSPSLVAHARALFVKRDPPYAGADLANARRMVTFLWTAGLALALVFLSFAPPTEAGAAGWPVMGALFVVNLAIVTVLMPRRPGFGTLLALGYYSLAQLAFLQWLTGGAESPFREFFLIAVVLGAGVHPPRRAALYLLVSAGAVAAPLVYEPSAAAGEEVGGRLLLWLSVGVAVMILMDLVRQQRIALGEEERRAQDLARVDALTGLLNRRGFAELVEGELAHSRREGTPLSVVLIDVDDFKEVNDLHGHLAGDDCLRNLSEAMTAGVRGRDKCFRWGGDEFALLLPGTDAPAAELLAERLATEASERCRRPDGSPLHVTHGTASLRPGDDLDSLVERADQQLLDRKASRRQLRGERAAGHVERVDPTP